MRALRPWPQTITAQIFSLIIVALLAGVGFASAVHWYMTRDDSSYRDPEVVAAAQAARIATIVQEARSARSPAELDQVLAVARRAGDEVEQLRLSDPGRPDGRRMGVGGLVGQSLRQHWDIEPLRPPSGVRGALEVQIGAETALLFHEPAHPVARRVMMDWATFGVAMVALVVILLSVYAVRWVTAPLSSIARVARSFGRAPDERLQPLREDGPREIAQVAEALNDMRRRIHSLVAERTRMLAAISHDLRTPLTRLRLRAESVVDGALSEGMLREIATIDAMLTETLAYLREANTIESCERVDLPSLLQTICAEFTDVGNSVSYSGPARHTFTCRSRALTRAISNVVDNGTKHGSAVTVALSSLDAHRVRIDVSDDGPGIPCALREKVFEPFFRADSARGLAGRASFGLGLSIARDIVRSQGGEIQLLDRVPHGLTVAISLAETTLNIT
jgi:signal transduction histidine kinase